MPRERTAYKELRKARKRHYKNISTKSDLRTSIKNFESLLKAKKNDEAKKALASLVSKLDKAASKDVIKKNTAARRISRLMKKLSAQAKA
ncbi:MAG: 30S ribosomal protein S20 [Candidatus Omnitrophica bacterium]|nr:30S ribosomal protein S20 [Candidatus Omnitrophota bacterium]